MPCSKIRWWCIHFTSIPSSWHVNGWGSGCNARCNPKSLHFERCIGIKASRCLMFFALTQLLTSPLVKLSAPKFIRSISFHSSLHLGKAHTFQTGEEQSMHSTRHTTLCISKGWNQHLHTIHLATSISEALLHSGRHRQEWRHLAGLCPKWKWRIHARCKENYQTLVQVVRKTCLKFKGRSLSLDALRHQDTWEVPCIHWKHQGWRKQNYDSCKSGLHRLRLWLFTGCYPVFVAVSINLHSCKNFWGCTVYRS